MGPDALRQTPEHIIQAMSQGSAKARQTWAPEPVGGAPQTTKAEPTPPTPEVAPIGGSDALSQREYRFEVHWKDPRGKSYDGAFLSVAPDMATEVAIARDIARQKGGHADDHLASSILDLITGMAYAEHMLKPEARPHWAKRIENIPYPELAKLLIQEVISHYTFFRTGGDGTT